MGERRPILVVEDDAPIASRVLRGLSAAGYEVELASDGERGSELALRGDFDLVVLDLMLPGLSGFELLEQWGSRIATPVIVLTARDELEARVQSFRLGAVDWMAVTLWMEELLARVRTRLRLVEEQPRRVREFADVALDLDGRTVTVAGEPVALTAHELNILAFLVERSDPTVP